MNRMWILERKKMEININKNDLQLKQIYLFI